MGTKISWATDTWSPIVGCSKISAGCLNCYAEKVAHRQAHMEKKRGGPDRYGDVLDVYGKWNGKTVFVESALTKPLHWRKPRKIFVCSMSDLFHESVDFEWICEVLVVAALCPQHEFKVLTKRPDIMLRFFTQDDLWLSQLPRTLRFYTSKMKVPTPYWLLKEQIPNVHLGVTVENQDNVWRIADVVRTPAAKRFLSIEPLLPGKLNLLLDSISYREIGPCPNELCDENEGCCACDYTGSVYGKSKIDHIYLGCESKGPKERLCSLDDMRYIMGQGRDAGVKIHVKQIPLNGKCNKNFDEWPEEFRVREV